MEQLRTAAALAAHAPETIRLAGMGVRAARGDPEAIDYFIHGGAMEALTLIRPDVAAQVSALIAGGRAAIDTIQHELHGNVIEGDFRIIDDDGARPWNGVMRWLLSLRYAAFVVWGPPQSGKTHLALRLAERLRERHGYDIWGVNLYPDNEALLEGIVPYSMEELADDMERLAAALGNNNSAIDHLLDRDEDGELAHHETREELAVLRLRAKEQILRELHGRIVIVDEAALGMHPRGAGPGKLAAVRALLQRGHVDWLIIYIGQLAKTFPGDTLNPDVFFIKKPQGWEVDADRDNHMVRGLWEAAGEWFDGLRSYEWWAVNPHWQAWAYTVARGYGERGYAGPMPFLMPGEV